MDLVDDFFNFIFPFIEEETASMLLLLLGSFSIILFLSSFRHYHHFTYGTFFIITSLLFLITALNTIGPQSEVASFLFLINLIIGVSFIILDFPDLKEFIKPSKIKQALYCEYYSNCPCGCNYGHCSVKKSWVSKREINVCENFERAKNLRWRLL